MLVSRSAFAVPVLLALVPLFTACSEPVDEAKAAHEGLSAAPVWPEGEMVFLRLTGTERGFGEVYTWRQSDAQGRPFVGVTIRDVYRPGPGLPMVEGRVSGRASLSESDPALAVYADADCTVELRVTDRVLSVPFSSRGIILDVTKRGVCSAFAAGTPLGTYADAIICEGGCGL